MPNNELLVKLIVLFRDGQILAPPSLTQDRAYRLFCDDLALKVWWCGRRRRVDVTYPYVEVSSNCSDSLPTTSDVKTKYCGILIKCRTNIRCVCHRQVRGWSYRPESKYVANSSPSQCTHCLGNCSLRDNLLKAFLKPWRKTSIPVFTCYVSLGLQLLVLLAV